MGTLAQARLYGIVDLAYVSAKDVLRVGGQMIDGGVDVIQLRGKRETPGQLEQLAGPLHRITSANNIPLIINDHPQVAKNAGAEGVHVGQDDLSVQEAREQAGPDVIVGKSTHSLEQAAAAQKEGADYIGFGPLFATPTKPDYAPIALDLIVEAHRRVQLPIFCIGGIKLENLAQVIAAGAQRVVIVSGLLSAPNIVEYARAARDMLEAGKPKIEIQRS